MKGDQYVGDGYTVVHNPTGYYLTQYNEDRSVISVNGVALQVSVTHDRNPVLLSQSLTPMRETWTYFDKDENKQSVGGLLIDVAMGPFISLIGNEIAEYIVGEILDCFGLGPDDLADFLLPNNYYFVLWSINYFGDIDPDNSLVHWRSDMGFYGGLSNNYYADTFYEWIQYYWR